MREAGAQDHRLGLDLFAVGQLGSEIAGLAIESRDGRARLDRDEVILLDTRNHAADGVFGPFAGGYELRVTGQDRRAAEAIFLLDQHALPADRAETVRRRKPGGPAANDQYRFAHYSSSLGLKPGPEVIILRGS